MARRLFKKEVVYANELRTNEAGVSCEVRRRLKLQNAIRPTDDTEIRPGCQRSAIIKSARQRSIVPPDGIDGDLQFENSLCLICSFASRWHF